MPLTQASLTANVMWSLQRVNAGGFRPTTQGPESSSFTLSGLDVAVWNQVATSTFVLASGTNQDIDLTNLTNLVSETFGFTKVKSVKVQPATYEVTFGPAAASGMVWPFSGPGDAAVIQAGGVHLSSDGAAASGHAVDATHKFWKLTASGAGTTTVDVEILGSTL